MKSSTICALLVGSLMLLAAISPALAVVGPAMAHETLEGSSWYSNNWSGYAVTGATGSVTSVNGSWIVPTVTGSSGSYSSFWVGIDGFNSNAVEQIGTDSDMGKTPSYYAWYEFYPNTMYQISTATTYLVSPGDVMSATVAFLSSSTSSSSTSSSSTSSSRHGVSITDTFNVSITDITGGWSFSTTGTVANAAMSSAEWIAEAPSSYRGALPLADFGTVYFSQCYSTMGAATGSIGSFVSNVQMITMATQTYNFRYNFRPHSYTIVLEAVPTTLSTDGTSFSVTWTSAGQDPVGFRPF